MAVLMTKIVALSQKYFRILSFHTACTQSRQSSLLNECQLTAHYGANNV